jgi:phosphatidylinositol alpha-1,6-mannosyltransferase
MDKPRKLKQPILFITRTYPPIIGGMEILSYDLTKTISHFTPTYLIRNPYGKKALPFFVVWAFVKAIIILLFKDVKVVHLSDGVLAPIGIILRFLFPRIKVVANIHGLDVAYVEQLSIYRYTNLWAIKKLDEIIAVSSEVQETCLKYGIPSDIITIIPNGTDADAFFDSALREEKTALWLKYFPNMVEKIAGRFIILSLGRIVKRKGLAWFIRNVMPNLPSKTVLVVAGSGPNKESVKKAIKDKNLKGRVFLLGFISDKIKKFLLNTADILIMPNIKVKGDREGFGITVIEAASSGLVPVVADLEGLRDSVEDQKNGLRLPSKNSKKFVETIKYLMNNPKERIKLGKKARKYVKENFDWSVVGRKYLEEFRKLEEQ